MSKDPQIGGPGAVVQTNAGVSIPKLDFSVIYLQREQASSGGEGDEEQSDAADQQ